jgi:gamma-glutamyltranspeptidase/glutathione hydrolase
MKLSWKTVATVPANRVLFLLLGLGLLAGCAGPGGGSVPSCDAPTARGRQVVVGSGLAGDPAAPEPASGYRVGRKAAYAKAYMVVTANPYASQAGCEVLRAGGSAVDAAVAVQAVLGLVEPQSSGLGGGAFMLHYDAKTRAVVSYDGRETAPAAATGNYLRYIDEVTTQTAPLPNARASGRSIGTPGVLRMLDQAHQDHGKMAWKGLFGSGVKLGTDGFPISGRMAAAIAGSRDNLLADAEARAYFLNPDLTAKPQGTVIRNPQYADTLHAIANGGVNAFYTGAIAQAIVDKIGATTGADGSTLTPGLTTLADLANYKAKKREPACILYRVHWVCGMGPPSSGGLAVAQSLGILENFSLAQHRPTAIDIEGGKPTVMGVHLVSEANRLAYADRDKYVADADFVPLPGDGVRTLLHKNYLRARADLISLTRSMGTATAGELGPVPLGVEATPESGTSHVTIVDRDGNALVMTTSVESTLGSFHMTRGFMLNNQLTDFSAAPADAAGTPIANRVAPGKRPRSSMAPTLVFEMAADGGKGPLRMATGSPGGATIIQYVTKTVVGVLDWGLDAQQATNLVDFGASNTATTHVGGEHPHILATDNGNGDPLVAGLRAMGHTVSVAAQSSGISTIVRTRIHGQPAWAGGADPRREGLVLGDLFVP